MAASWQQDFKIEAYGQVTDPPDVGLTDAQRTEVERLVCELAVLTGLRPGSILTNLYQQMQE
jgi:hypothetical protein